MPYYPLGSAHVALPSVYTEIRTYTGANMIYKGIAPSGTGTNRANWQIQQRTYDGSNNLTDIKFADGNLEMDNLWSAFGGNVSSITRSGTTVTVTTAAAHGLATNDKVAIAGSAVSNYNSNAGWTVTATPTTTTFTFTISGTPADDNPSAATWLKANYAMYSYS